MASLGSKKIADPTELAVFNRLKKEAERVCLKVGTRFLGAFAVPEDFIGPVQTELERIAMGFSLARDKFLSGYDDAVKGWVAKHPEFAEAIIRAVDPVETVAANLRFDYVVFRVSQPQLPEEDISPELAASLDRKVESLSDTLFREVAQDAADLVENSLLGRQSATRKALSPLKKMRDKLDGLAFLDHRVNRVVQTLDETLSRVPKTGPLEGAYLQEVFALALLLSDSEKTKRHGEGLVQTEDLLSVQDDEIVWVSASENKTAQASVYDGGIDQMSAQDNVIALPSVQDVQAVEVSPISVAPDAMEAPSVGDEKSNSSPLDRFSLFAGLDEELEEEAAESPVERAVDFIPVNKPEPLPIISTEFWF